MSVAELTSLITAITALVGAIGGLITLFMHMRNHGGNATVKPVDSTANSGTKAPGNAGRNPQ